FFVSSRRRHTRSKRDCSSDVCSSDLRKIPITFFLADRTGSWRIFPVQPQKKRGEQHHEENNNSKGSRSSRINHGTGRNHNDLCKIGRASCRERAEIGISAGEKKQEEG